MHLNGCFLYAIFRCGTVSGFNSIHLSPWEVWKPIPHITTLFHKLSLPITEVSAEVHSELEHYVSCTNSFVLVIWTTMHQHSAMWMRQGNVYVDTSKYNAACSIKLRLEERLDVWLGSFREHIARRQCSMHGANQIQLHKSCSGHCSC